MKATGTDWIKVATQVFMGVTLAEQGMDQEKPLLYSVVKEAVFSFDRYPRS